MVNDNGFSTSFGAFTLSRWSRTNTPSEQNLQAWDAADELLLEHLAQVSLPESARVLILNDQSGALVTTLAAAKAPGCSVQFATDSYLSTQAAQKNVTANGGDVTQVTWLNSLDRAQGSIDVLLIKLPKNLSLLEDQLYRYRDQLNPHTKIIAAGMVKHMAAGVFKLFEDILGATKTSLAKKKARLIFCELDKTQWLPAPDLNTHYVLENTNYQITNYPNVFSRESLDIGTRFFLQHFPKKMQVEKIADIGCGNGILGLVATGKYPEATVDFYDESYMAVACAEQNFTRAWPDRMASFRTDDGMSNALPDSYQLIVCNPPFHQHNVVGDFVALQMFRDAKSALQQGGEFWLVGNRHLPYKDHIKHLFGNSMVVASNQKFVVLKAIKR
ncbi:methyltransferase [Simiduia curdlanivorans]|uniref:Methyltransferase n=1 Tax=Simiduia curdlanivorans TaxID=1492769 RepID=A0ABV8UZG2_9GAMM|nr:methyltransferase [Simiduia curdlanivorans]MDN3638080.1 methyltransferase [Simiduia curdlanivorans]